MRTKVALNHCNRAEAALTDLLSRAKIYGFTHERVLGEYIKIADSVKHCPAWVRSRLSVVFRERWNAFHTYGVIVWQLYLDGRRVDSKDIPSGQWHKVQGQHEWKGNGKPVNNTRKA